MGSKPKEGIRELSCEEWAAELFKMNPPTLEAITLALKAAEDRGRRKGLKEAVASW